MYLDTYTEKQKRRQEELDFQCWLQGRYFVDALNQALQFKNPKRIYPNEPYLIKEKKSKMTLKEKALAWINNVNRKFKKGEN